MVRAGLLTHEPPPSGIINSSATRASSGFYHLQYMTRGCVLYSITLPHIKPVRQGAVASLRVARSLFPVKGKVYDKLSTMSTHSATAQPQALSQCAHRENLCLRPHPRPVTSSRPRRSVGQQEISASSYFLLISKEIVKAFNDNLLLTRKV